MEDARSRVALLEIHHRPEKYFSIKHQQNTKGPLLVAIKNTNLLVIKKLTLVSRLLDHKRSVIKEISWPMNEPLMAGERSRYFPVPISDHLKQDEYVQTQVQKVAIQH